MAALEERLRDAEAARADVNIAAATGGPGDDPPGGDGPSYIAQEAMDNIPDFVDDDATAPVSVGGYLHTTDDDDIGPTSATALAGAMATLDGGGGDPDEPWHPDSMYGVRRDRPVDDTTAGGLVVAGGGGPPDGGGGPGSTIWVPDMPARPKPMVDQAHIMVHQQNMVVNHPDIMVHDVPTQGAVWT
jgi:hypothetical protein